MVDAIRQLSIAQVTLEMHIEVVQFRLKQKWAIVCTHKELLSDGMEVCTRGSKGIVTVLKVLSKPDYTFGT